jgi:Flp pilus assembly protein TadD
MRRYRRNSDEEIEALSRQAAVEPWNVELLTRLAVSLERAGRLEEAAARRHEAETVQQRQVMALVTDALKRQARSPRGRRPGATRRI